MTGTDSIRAVVADDSHFVRTVVEGILDDHDIEVVGTARDGTEAVDLVLEHEPDVVTMDIEMPEMNGLEAVDRIMDEQPTPILMLSAHTDENADVTFDALERGAVDVFTKPGGEVSTQLSGHDQRLAEAVQSVASADVSGSGSSTAAGSGRAASTVGSDSTAPADSAADSATTARGSTADSDRATSSEATDTATGASPSARADRRPRKYVERPTLVIAASTGGPSVVERVLSELPAETELRVLVVQHMPADFTDRFAARLDENTAFDVSEAGDGDRIGAGEGVVAPGGYHMEVAGYAAGRLRLKLTEEAAEHGVRPAADVTMRTAAAAIDDPMVGVVLTGMGEDGAAGAEALQEAGAHLVVQDEDSASVSSMPKHAIETGAVDEVHPTDGIADAVLEAIEGEQ